MSEREESFEKALEKLERIAAKLETGDIPLEKGVALYKEGMQANPDRRGRTGRGKASKSSRARARVISRARSARKLKKNTASLSRITPSPPARTRGLTNSSVSPAV